MSEDLSTTSDDPDFSILDNLSDEEKVNLAHFREIAGNIDLEEAIRIMTDNAWSLQAAVHSLMGISEPNEVRPRIVRSNSHNVPRVELSPPNQRVVHSRELQPISWFQLGFSFITSPVRLIYGIAIFFTKAIFSVLWPDPRATVLDPIGDVKNFIKFFETKYCGVGRNTEAGIIRTPPFFQGSYAQAVSDAKQSLRFLIVYLHGDDHPDSDEFCKKILCASNVLDFLSDSGEIVFWACNVNSPEGYRVSRTLREHSYPFIGVIGLSFVTHDEQSHATTMAMLARFEGMQMPDNLVTQLRSIMHDRAGAMHTARMERMEREANQRIRREQDEAFNQSLEADRAKKREREAEEAAKRELEANANELKRQAELRQIASCTRRKKWFTSLPPEPDPSTMETVKLMIKMPDGQRLSRVFDIHDSVKLLYYFVLSRPNCPESFELESVFPKRIINCRPGVESDIEDYMSGSNQGRDGDTSSGSGQSPATDWRPNKMQDDPPSFAEMGLIKPEMIMVLDSDA